MIVKYLNWVLVAACAAFLMIGTYNSRLTKVCFIIAIVAFFLIKLLEKNRPFFKNLFEFGKALVFRGHFFFSHPDGLTESYYSQRVFGPRAPASLLMPAADQRAERNSFFHVYGARAFRAVYFVGRERKKINSELLNVYRYFTYGLDRVSVKKRALRVHYFGYFLYASLGS